MKRIPISENPSSRPDVVVKSSKVKSSVRQKSSESESCTRIDSISTHSSVLVVPRSSSIVANTSTLTTEDSFCLSPSNVMSRCKIPSVRGGVDRQADKESLEAANEFKVVEDVGNVKELAENDSVTRKNAVVEFEPSSDIEVVSESLVSSPVTPQVPASEAIEKSTNSTIAGLKATRTVSRWRDAAANELSPICPSTIPCVLADNDADDVAVDFDKDADQDGENEDSKESEELGDIDDDKNPYHAPAVPVENSKDVLVPIFDVEKQHLAVIEYTEGSKKGDIYYKPVPEDPVMPAMPIPGSGHSEETLDKLFRHHEFKELLVASGYFEIVPFGERPTKKMVKESFVKNGVSLHRMRPRVLEGTKHNVMDTRNFKSEIKWHPFGVQAIHIEDLFFSSTVKLRPDVWRWHKLLARTGVEYVKEMFKEFIDQ